MDSEYLSEEEGVAIFQISSEKKIFLFDIISLKKNHKFKTLFLDLMSNENIIKVIYIIFLFSFLLIYNFKVGHSIAGDCSQIQESFDFTEQILINNYYEITKLYQNLRAMIAQECLKTSLKHIAKELLSNIQ